MVSPVDEHHQLHEVVPPFTRQRSSDDDGTIVGDDAARADMAGRPRSNTHLTADYNLEGHDRSGSATSPSRVREEAHRLRDDLELLKVERQVSRENESFGPESTQSGTVRRSRSRREEPVDEFDVATNPLHERTAVYKPPEHPNTSLSKLFKKIHNSSFLVRYFTYIVPVVLILLIPLLLGVFVFKTATVGGVQLMWFSIWLEIVWLTLWAGRILAKCLPWPIGLVSSLFTNNDKKWRDMGKQLEMPATLFFWWLAIEISFLPTVTNHVQGRGRTTFPWMVTMNKVLVSIFVGAILNFIEKIIIQLIAISFHLRTYSDRIEVNKFQIGSLTKLYKFSKDKIEMEDSEFEAPSAPSGARTPAQIVEKAQKTTKEAINKFGDVAGRIAGDFTGRQVVKSTHPHQVVLTLLSTSSGSQVLARRLYRTFYRDDTETIHSDDLKEAFDDEEEAAAAFTMFDKDMNGDISMKELEDVCVEIGRERKSITASLKDLDSVVSKLDHVFLFIVIVVTILVFISLLSTSAAGVLTSAGSTVLALSWLFSATAQEFLQSVIFVFVKHPFDVGDRVSVYGNTGALGRGDDYYVKEISLLYTEFKKLQGHVVQAPNSYLNTLFILNQRRSGGLAEAIPIVIKFGTTLEQIEQLRARLLEFVSSEAERREYQPNIITEVTEVTEVHSISVNVVFFYKSNWQNELVRLNRRNKFVCVLMVAIQDLGIEGPRMRFPGQKESYPVYLQNIPHPGSTVPGPSTMDDKQGENQPVAPPDAGNNFVNRMPSILRTGSIRPRGESLSEVARRVDFSLGMRDVKDVPYGGDVYEDRSRERERSRLAMSVQSPERRSLEQGRSSMDTGRSSALADASRPRGNSLRRVPTDASDRFSRTSHRNRFFGRGRNRDEESILEEGMPDIPESRNQSLDQRLDPRTGTVSSTAVRWDTENLHTAASGALPTTESQNRHFQRSQTEKHETEKLQ